MALVLRALIPRRERSLRGLRRANHSKGPALQHSRSLAETSLPGKNLRRTLHLLRIADLALHYLRGQLRAELWELGLVATARLLLAKCQMVPHPRGRS